VLWLAAPARVRVELNAVAQALRVSARADQRLVVSGKLSGRLEDDRLTVRGALVADQAQFVLPEDSAPRLGADVVVRPVARAKAPAGPVKAPPPRKPLALDIEISLDPGNNFQLSGNGLRTRLAGLVKLTTDPGAASLTPRLRGELRTVGGSYKAYGQALDITQGVLRFSGPYDNPTLDILALRPNLQQQVGVQISGTAQLPKVRLYADPDLPEAEKLSWLMLGRAPTAGGGGGADNALFQRAAMALLSGSGPSPAGDFMGAFGLDEMSVGETNTTNADGTNGATATTVKLGKRLSRDFYVAYERSIASTLGTFYVFYDLSRRFTLRAESGAHSAIDLIFTTRFD
jgi:translocation and assembly module TamB